MLLTFQLTGRVTPKYIHSEISTGKRTERIGILKPISLIGVIEQGNKVYLDSTLSNQTKEVLLVNTLKITDREIPGKEVHVDTATYSYVYRHIMTLAQKQYAQKGMKNRHLVLQNYILPDTLEALMKEQEVDQLVVTYHKGFTRTKKNYANQNLKGLGVGLLTLGMYIPTPVKSNSLLHTWVLDRTRKTVAFSNVSMIEVDPTDARSLMGQLCELYQGLYTKKSADGVCGRL